jgi:hypothetical protein
VQETDRDRFHAVMYQRMRRTGDPIEVERDNDVVQPDRGTLAAQQDDIGERAADVEAKGNDDGWTYTDTLTDGGR